MKCSECEPYNYPFPICEKTGVGNEIQCPVCRTIFDEHGKIITKEKLKERKNKKAVLSKESIWYTGQQKYSYGKIKIIS